MINKSWLLNNNIIFIKLSIKQYSQIKATKLIGGM